MGVGYSDMLSLYKLLTHDCTYKATYVCSTSNTYNIVIYILPSHRTNVRMKKYQFMIP